jgi:flavin reductase (DIM6/NTAB) family NADH-FMN oxidoreductase RutF
MPARVVWPQVGDEFVLNVLGESKSTLLMKHFLKRFPPGADRFEGIRTQTAGNGSPVLNDAIAHLECTVRFLFCLHLTVPSEMHSL